MDDGLADHGVAVVVAIDVPVVHEENWVAINDYLKVEFKIGLYKTHKLSKACLHVITNLVLNHLTHHEHNYKKG